MIDISIWQLLLCCGFVAISGISSLLLQLGLEKKLLWGTVRTFAQLGLLGYVLKYIFQINDPLLILLLFVWMVFWAAYTIRSRVQSPNIPLFVPTFMAMLISYTTVTIVVTAFIVQVQPWYKPQYFITLGGMIVGNSMNAIAIALDRLLSDLRQQRATIELYLCLGATYQEATISILRNAVQAGMIPSINALMTVGLVFLPGMMTGQILAGTDPVTAIKYQIVVMLMLTASTASGCVIVSFIIRRLCFTQAQQLAVL